MQGRSVAELAAERGISPALFVVRLLADEDALVGFIAFAMSEEDVRLVMRHPCVAIGSDAAATAPGGDRGLDKIHPRAYGTFPRVLGHYTRDERVLTLEDAVRKMTSLPAARIGFTDRGRIAEGAFADLVAFDPERVRDTATYQAPHSFPVGIPWVWVNGTAVIEEGRHTGATPGQVLRGSGRPRGVV